MIIEYKDVFVQNEKIEIQKYEPRISIVAVQSYISLFVRLDLEVLATALGIGWLVILGYNFRY